LGDNMPEKIKTHEQVPKNALVYTFKDDKPEVLLFRKNGE